MSHAAAIEWVVVALGLIALYVPTYVDLARNLWRSDEQAHGPMILAISLWFLWQKRSVIAGLAPQPATSGWPILGLGLLLYVLGRSQDILMFEIGSQMLVFPAVLVLLRGWAAWRLAWFPLLFLIFMVPLPGTLVDALTLPMKIGVSWATEQVLFALGYPISRAGVVLQIGQYKLLVADACAGLHTLFTLEALGLFYLHVVRHESWVRNTALALLIVPISLSANTIRVVTLALITYHLGDEAGRGFLHGFAGIVLFMTALFLIMGLDSLIQTIGLRRLKGGQARA